MYVTNVAKAFIKVYVSTETGAILWYFNYSVCVI